MGTLSRKILYNFKIPTCGGGGPRSELHPRRSHKEHLTGRDLSNRANSYYRVRVIAQRDENFSFRRMLSDRAHFFQSANTAEQMCHSPLFQS